jgi:hypothetical protein
MKHARKQAMKRKPDLLYVDLAPLPTPAKKLRKLRRKKRKAKHET